MFLQSLIRYAERHNVTAGMEVKQRCVHLVINLDHGGGLNPSAPWTPLYRDVPTKNGEAKKALGALLVHPEFPGVSKHARAYFLADSPARVLGIDPETCEVVSDDPGSGNDAKAFLKFWSRISDAYDETGNASLEAMLAFRDRHLKDERSRSSLGSVRRVESGRKPVLATDTEPPIPLAGLVVTFSVGAVGVPVFEEGGELHDYWSRVFEAERFSGGDATVGTCIITGKTGEPVAESHRTPVVGVPKSPPGGAYMVSFDAGSPAFKSYGFESGWNAPVNDRATALYALALNRLLGQREYRVLVGDSVLVGWSDSDEDVNLCGLIARPPDAPGLTEYFEAFRSGSSPAPGFESRRWHSLLMAANGGRVAVRAAVDAPLAHAVESVRKWFDDLSTDSFVESTVNPYSLWALANATTSPKLDPKQSTYDLLIRAAFDPNFAPVPLLGLTVQRLRGMGAGDPDSIPFQTSSFAVLKMVLTRMNVLPDLECHDPAYDCGRLLALLSEMQYAALGQVKHSVTSRFYGATSMCPRNGLSTLLRLEKHHRHKLTTHGDPSMRAAGVAIGREIDALCDRFSHVGGFPGPMDQQQQARFALGYHQQMQARRNAANERRRAKEEAED